MKKMFLETQRIIAELKKYIYQLEAAVVRIGTK